MRILYYNWADYLDPEKRGGGVSVYQRNLVKTLSQREGIETGFLSAGLAYRVRSSRPHVVRQKGAGPRRWVLVNSGTLAPSHAGFAAPEQLDHAATVQAFAEFVARTGPWDVIHFNNLEGLPASVLSLKERFPETRFILSLHNYYPFCPQVNLWHAERETCDDYHAGTLCARCLVAQPSARSVRATYATGWALTRRGLGPGSPFYDRIFRPAAGSAWRAVKRLKARRHHAGPAFEAAVALAEVPVEVPPGAGPGEAFVRRRARMVALINAHCDHVLCVSDRVRQIALHHGIHASRLQTQYIGTAEAAEWHYTKPRASFLKPDGTLHLAYLGYMRRDKGFLVLMQALAALPRDQAQRLQVTIAARSGEAEPMAAMQALEGHVGRLRHVDGYTHEGLNDLLRDVDLGMVPVLWEDNLPQVAIEMHARHIPLLTSDRGGAQELGRCPSLVFRAGDVDSFHHALGQVLDGRVTPAAYWDHAIAPVSLPDHVAALLALYEDRR